MYIQVFLGVVPVYESDSDSTIYLSTIPTQLSILKQLVLLGSLRYVRNCLMQRE